MTFIETVTISCVEVPEIEFWLSPVLTFGEFSAYVESNMSFDGQISIIRTFSGEIVYTDQVTIQPGTNVFNYNFDDIPNIQNGIYMVSFTYPGGINTYAILYIG